MIESIISPTRKGVLLIIDWVELSHIPLISCHEIGVINYVLYLPIFLYMFRLGVSVPMLRSFALCFPRMRVILL